MKKDKPPVFKAARSGGGVGVHYRPTCITCEHCVYIGEGDHICDVHQVLVLEDHAPSDNFYLCGGVDYE